MKAAAEHVERLVDAYARRELAELTMRVEEPTVETGEDSHDETLLTDLARMLGERQITMAEYVAARGPVEKRRKERARERRQLPLAQIGGVGADAVLAAWDDLPPDLRRAVYAQVLDAVFIDPVVQRTGPRFQPGRVRPLSSRRSAAAATA